MGAGGIGSTAIQIGAAMGLQVFATAGSADSCTYCEDLGAQRSINFNEKDFVPILREIGGANIILDIIGGDYVARNIRAAHADAKIVQLAFNLGSKIEVDLMPIMLKRLTLTGSTLRSRSDDFKSEVASDLIRTIWPLFGSSPPKLRTTTLPTLTLPMQTRHMTHGVGEQTRQNFVDHVNVSDQRAITFKQGCYA